MSRVHPSIPADPLPLPLLPSSVVDWLGWLVGWPASLSNTEERTVYWSRGTIPLFSHSESRPTRQQSQPVTFRAQRAATQQPENEVSIASIATLTSPPVLIFAFQPVIKQA